MHHVFLKNSLLVKQKIHSSNALFFTNHSKQPHTTIIRCHTGQRPNYIHLD